MAHGCAVPGRAVRDLRARPKADVLSIPAAGFLATRSEDPGFGVRAVLPTLPMQPRRKAPESTARQPRAKGTLMSQPNISNEKLRANQKNAQHSTGPRTEAGKQRVSQNALKHGLLAR